MSAGPRLIAILVIVVTLSGCGYRPLKAPCSADEGGVPMAYSSLTVASTSGPANAPDGCGPMRKI